MKRFGKIVLTLTLVLALAAPTMAEEEQDHAPAAGLLIAPNPSAGLLIAPNPSAGLVIAPNPMASSARTYEVVKGDCLWSIARVQLGSGARWQEIYDLNRDLIREPNMIYVGQQLKLPA